MISSFRIQGYRKFSYFELNNLGRVNFFVGKNNVGKTTLLESVLGWACGYDLSPFMGVCVQRNQFSQYLTPYHIAENIVAAVNDRRNIPFSFKFTAMDDGKEISYTHKVSLGDVFKDFIRDVATDAPAVNPVMNPNMNSQMQMVPNVPVAQWEVAKSDEDKRNFLLGWPNTFIENVAPQQLANYEDISGHRNMAENRKLYVHLKRHNLIGKFVQEMQEVFPEITDFDILPYQDNSMAPVSAQVANGDYFPLDTFGDGLRCMFQIVGALIFYHDGIMCIDEIDSTIHPEAQRKLCHSLIKYARKYNVQLFVTTHNLEFIDIFLSSWQEDESLNTVDDIRIVSMKSVDDEVKARTMTGLEAMSAREDFNMELR